MSSSLIIPFETGKGKFLAVKVPEDISSDILDYLLEHCQGNMCNLQYPFKEPIGEHPYEVIGLSHELTDEQMERICERLLMSSMQYAMYGQLYRDYSEVRGLFNNGSSLKESFRTLMHSLQCWEVNPYGELWHHARYAKLTRKLAEINSQHQPYAEYKKQWQQAQERTGKWLILKQL